jgi:hypothetical protein
MVYFIFNVAVICALSIFCVYTLIEFFEYLKKFHAIKWRQISFDRPFGIAQENFYFYPIRLLKFIPFLFSKDDSNDANVTIYKTILKLTLLVITFILLFAFFMC